MKLLISIIFCILGNYLVVAKTSSCVFEWVSGCTLYTSCQGGGSFETTNQKLLEKNCFQGTIFWSYPTSNMTITFTRNQEASEAFDLLISGVPYGYQIVNGEEIELPSSPDKLTLKSDLSNAVVIKSVGPDSIFAYGDIINFKIINPIIF